MLVGMNRTVKGQGLEEKEGEAGGREVGLEEQEKGERILAPDNSLAEESRNGKDNADHISSEERYTDIEIEGEHGTERGRDGKAVDGWEGHTFRNADACNAQLHEEPGKCSGK